MSNPALDPIVKQLMEDAAIGEAAKSFMQSGLGSYLAKRANDEADEAMAQLVEVNAANTQEVAALQMKIRIATQAVGWLMQAISEGDNALRQLHEES